MFELRPLRVIPAVGSFFSAERSTTTGGDVPVFPNLISTSTPVLAMTMPLSSLPFSFVLIKPHSGLVNPSPNRLSRPWRTLIDEARASALLSGQVISVGPFFKAPAATHHHSVTTFRTKLASV
jgi:hypothetical protein